MNVVWGWLEWAGIIAAMWAVFALGLGVMIGRALRRRQPMPRIYDLSDEDVKWSRSLTAAILRQAGLKEGGAE